MDAGSWMEAFERASERLVEDWQAKLVTTGLLAEGIFPVELISLFALAVFIDLVTKWMALAHKYLAAKGEADRDMVSCILAIPAAHRAGMISSRQMKRQFAGKMVLYIRRQRCGRPASGKRGTAGPVYGNVCQLSGGVGDAEYRGESE